MLGWAQVDAHVRGDGKLWSPGPLIVVPIQSGVCTVLSVHWCDVNVEVRTECHAVLTAGVPSAIFDRETPLIIVGPMPANLPPITVGSTAISVPAGRMGAKGSA